MVDLLSDSITNAQDLSEIQNQSTKAQYSERHGLWVMEWSVAAQMAINGETTSLTAGTYYLKQPQPESNANVHSWDNFYIPAGTCILNAIGHIHTARAGGTSITPSIGATSLGATGALDTTAATDLIAADLAGGGAPFTRGQIIASDSDFKVVTVGAVTAGAFTIIIEYLLLNVG